MRDIAAVILAAGRSRRMGAFKPLLPFGGRTVIECCVENLRAADVEEIVVVVGHRQEDLRSQLGPLEVSFAVNEDPDTAMSVSIARGVAAVNTNTRALLIALADHPAVPPETITILIDEWQRGARLVQPEHEGRGGHPVLIDLVYRNELLALDSKSGLRGLFSTHRADVKRVAVQSPYVARDMDTWEDYRRLHEDVFESRQPVFDVECGDLSPLFPKGFNPNWADGKAATGRRTPQFWAGFVNVKKYSNEIPPVHI